MGGLVARAQLLDCTLSEQCHVTDGPRAGSVMLSACMTCTACVVVLVDVQSLAFDSTLTALHLQHPYPLHVSKPLGVLSVHWPCARVPRSCIKRHASLFSHHRRSTEETVVDVTVNIFDHLHYISIAHDWRRSAAAWAPSRSIY